MLERIKMFDQKKSTNIPSNNNKKRISKNNIETPDKNIAKINHIKISDKNNTNIKTSHNQEFESDYLINEIHRNKFIESPISSFSNNNNSYVRQSIKRQSFLKKHKDNNNINSSLFPNTTKESKNPKQNKSIDKNSFIYKKFINNLKLGIRNNNEKDLGGGENTKKNKNKKKKIILGNFLNQFVNKIKPQEEPNIKNKNISIIHNNAIKYNISNNINIFIEANKKQNHEIKEDNKDKYNEDIIKLKKELDIKENKIKELSNIIESQKIKIKENEKLTEEIQYLKNLLKQINNSDDDSDKKEEDNKAKDTIKNPSINIENNKYNNLITYNINKNNNYNIINSQINNLDELNIKKNNIEEPIITNTQIPKKEKEKENEKNEEKEKERAKKATRAFERFKRAHKSMDLSDKDKGNILKSEKISIIAKMLEGHIPGPEETQNIKREKSVEVCHNNNEDNEMANIISNQPVINKKKKKMNSFSSDD